MNQVSQPLILSILLFTVLIVTPACIASEGSSNITISFLDVGQGDCSLLEVNGKTMLIDAGPSDAGPEIVRCLKNQNITSLDIVLSTHPHSDHIGGMPYVINHIKTGLFIDSGDPHTTPTYESLLKTINRQNIRYTTVRDGDTIDLDPGIQIRVLNPPNIQGEDLNENSIVLKISAGPREILLMGDAGITTEESLLTRGEDLRADILKVGHHGSRHSSEREFIKAVSPEIAIIFLASDNDYGYPQKNPIQYLSDEGAKIYRTDHDGTVTINIKDGVLNIKTRNSSP